MKRIVLLLVTAVMLTVGVQAQEKKASNGCTSCKVEKKDSCSSGACPFCKDVERERKLAKVKGAGRTLPLPLDTTRCEKCRKNAPNKGIKKISHTM